MTKKTAKLVQGLILITFPIALIGLIMVFFESFRLFSIINDDFYPATLNVSNVRCVPVNNSSSAETRCTASGYIIVNGDTIQQKVYLGYFSSANISKNKYEIFYRENGKHSIINPLGVQKLDKTLYTRKLVILIFLTILGLLIIISLYHHLNKILKS